MNKIIFLAMSIISSSLANSSSSIGEIPDLTFTWIGIASLVIFIIGYYFIAAEEKYYIDKAKPALFVGTLCLC